MDPMHQEAADASERAFGRVFEEGVRLYAQLLWQYASRRQRSKYPQYGMSAKEFRRLYRAYQERVAENDAVSLAAVIAVIEEAIPVYDTEPTEDIDVRIAGENLKAVSMFLCCLGEPACTADVDFLLATTWDLQSTLLERRHIRSYEGRKELLIFLNVLLAHASNEVKKLGVERGVSELRYYTFDESDNFALDHGVLETNYFALCSLIQCVEIEVGHA